MNYKNYKRGFTLIELLVVVLIIGILASIALPQYERAVWKSRFAEVYTVTSSLEKAIQLYILSNGYPSAQVNLGPDDLDIDTLSNLRVATVHGNPSYCSKHVCYSVRCVSDHCEWRADMYRDAEHPSYQTEFSEMFGYLYSSNQAWGPRANSWYRSCWWEEGIPTEDVGRFLCQSTQWPDVGSGF